LAKLDPLLVNFERHPECVSWLSDEL